MNKRLINTINNGIIKDNPIFIQVIGMCPTLAVTTSASNGLGMGLSTLFVLMMSNFFVSILSRFIPDKVRIPAYIIIIATFVTLVQFILQAYLPELNSSLGLFIPLIVVNCLILARAEAFASKNNPLISLVDGIAMGLGFTIALVILGAIRELFGVGSIFGVMLLPPAFPRTIVMILPPGAFITLGLIMALLNYVRRAK